MPKDPGVNLGSERLPTRKSDIGHVTPSFVDSARFNTLIIRSIYRISLRLGSIEDLFPDAPDSERGRMARLQVLGLFYFPLGHAQAQNAFRGRAAAGTVPAVRGHWQYFRTRVCNNVDDAGADTEIQKRLREWVVHDGALPPAARDGETSTLANFAKLRLPGGYTILKSWQNNALDLNDDTSANYNGWSLGKDMYDVETRFRTDNPVLGKIPLVALVEKLDTATLEWVPTADVSVYFQLLPPYPMPGFDPSKDVNDDEQFNRPPLRASTLGPPPQAAGAGPAAIANREENPAAPRAPAADDPQGGNCRHDRGGKQGRGSLTDGTDVAGGSEAQRLFSLVSTPGFNEALATPRTLSHAHDYPLATLPSSHAGGKHRHAVTAKTNEDGEAGVIFLPSRCGGDRYRFRAYIGPPTLSGPGADGTGIRGVRVDTGTLVLWRNLRISRYVRQPANNPHASLLAEVNNATYNINSNNDYLRAASIVDSTGTNKGLPTADMSLRVDATKAFDPLPVQWARGFVEVEIDRAAQASLPGTLTQAEWQAARQTAMRDAQGAMAGKGLNLDLTRLFHMEAGSPINMANAVVHLPMRTREAYNALIPAPPQINLGAGGNSLARINALISEYALVGFFRHLASNGYTPGLNIIQGAYGCTWSLTRVFTTSSGTSLEYRGGFVYAGADFYAATQSAPPATRPPWLGYDMTSNTCHELGHVCYRLHGPGADPGRSPGGGNSAALHDPIPNNESVCVMSYQSSEGQFCAKCLFAFRGWDMATMP